MKDDLRPKFRQVSNDQQDYPRFLLSSGSFDFCLQTLFPSKLGGAQRRGRACERLRGRGFRLKRLCSQPCRMVDEQRFESEADFKMFCQGANAQGLRRIVARIDHIDSMLLRFEVRVVIPLARQ